MAWTLDQIITGRRDRLLTQFARGSLMPVVEVDDRAKLASLMHLGEFPKGGLPGNLGGRQPQNVSVVAATAHDPHAGSVWVRGFEYAGYRDAYLEFLKVSYGLTVSASQFSREYDVDHLLNRAQTGSEVALHRVEALPSWINRLWGSYLEKLASFRKLDPDDPEEP